MEHDYIANTPPTQEQLFRILNSKTFRRAERIKKMLEYCAAQTLAGHADALTEEKIGIEALGRDPKRYNPKSNAVVRKTKHDLNHHLDRYYAKEGSSDSIRFVIPGGAYYVGVEPSWQPAKLEQSIEKSVGGHTITIERFKRFLDEMCFSEEISSAEKNSRVNDWKGYTTDYHAFSLAKDDEFNSFFANFPSDTGSTISLSDMRSLTKYLGIHPMMMDPLRSEPIDCDHMALRFQSLDDFMRVGQVNEETYGRGARYYVPSRKMSGTDASFVFLELDPGGRSDAHHHQGDELMFVLSGSIELRLMDTGLRTVLGEGDVAYYYAEQTHCAIHLSGKPARALVIRFYQIAQEGSRQEIRKELRKTLTQAGQMASPAATGFVLQTLAGRGMKNPFEPEISSPVPDEIQDRLGLVRFLRRLPQPSEDKSKTFLSKLPLDALAPTFSQWLNQLECGQARLSKANLVDLRRLYEGFPLLYDIFPLLSYGFLFPGVFGSIAFRRTDPEDEIDIETIAPGLLSDGVSYIYPRRSLCCSDVSISRLTLKPQKGSRWNRHPGCELLIPIEGEGVVSFKIKNETQNVPAKKMSLVHYRSVVEHRVYNPSQEADAVFFLVRFYAEG